VHHVLHRQPGGFHDGLHVLQRLPRLAFNGAGKCSPGVASALPGDVEKIAGENSRTVRTDGLDAGWSDVPPSLTPCALSFGEASPPSLTPCALSFGEASSFLRSYGGNPREDHDNADQNEREAPHCDS